MTEVHRGSWIGLLAVVAVGCTASRMPVRFGSLKMSERSFVYGHGVDTFTLPNGLTVALAPDVRANLVSVDVRYTVGAANDPRGKSGLAHLVEHAMFERRPAADGPSLGDRLSTVALYHNASTTWDATHFREIALADRLDELLAIELSRMRDGCAGLDAAAFDRERAVVLQEIAQRSRHGDDLVTAIVADVYGAEHRYVAGEGGRDVAGLTAADVCGFADAHYGPDRAILVVSGRIDPRAVRSAIVAQFGALTRHSTGAHAQLAPPTLIGGTTEHRADVHEAAAVVVFAAAPWGSPEWVDDELVNALMVRRLDEGDQEHRFITHVESGVLGGRRNSTRYIVLSVADPAQLDDAVDRVFTAAAELPDGGSGLILGAVAARWRSRLFDQFESVGERGQHGADYLQFTDHKLFHLRELSMLQSIDTDRLKARARRIVRQVSHVIRILPSEHVSSGARPQLASATAATDTPAWRAAVDPAEADRSLALPAGQHALPVHELQLPSGMRVLLVSDFTQPVFEARLVFPVGDHGAGPGRARIAEGAAQLLNHNFLRGYTIADLATLDWVMRLGARLSAQVDEATTFTVRGTSTFADWHVWRLHWLLENGIYSYDEVKRANEAALRRATRPDTDRSWRRALREGLFGRAHPYARDFDLGRPGELDGDDLEDFRNAHYRARGATLIVVGKFDRTAMTRTVTELFGAWSTEPPPALPQVPPMQPVAGPTWIGHADPDAAQVRITLAFAATSSRNAARGPRLVVGEMLRSRIGEVRTRLGASYGIQTAYRWTTAGDMITVDGYVDADRAGEALRLMLADLDGLRAGDDGFTADFIRARRAALARTLADPMQSSVVADQLEATVTHHLPSDAASALPSAIATTTPTGARDVIAADLRPARMVVLLSGRSEDVTAAFKAASVARYQTVSDATAAATAK